MIQNDQQTKQGVESNMNEKDIKNQVLEEFEKSAFSEKSGTPKQKELLEWQQKRFKDIGFKEGYDKAREEFEKENEFEIEGRKHRFYNGIIVCCNHFCDYDGLTIKNIIEQEHRKIVVIIKQKIEELEKKYDKLDQTADSGHDYDEIIELESQERILQQILEEIQVY